MSAARLSAISGNPHEPVVVIGDDLDQPGNLLISRLPAAESVAASDVADYDADGAKAAAQEGDDESAEGGSSTTGTANAPTSSDSTSTDATASTPTVAPDEHDDTAAQPGEGGAPAAPASGDTGQ